MAVVQGSPERLRGLIAAAVLGCTPSPASRAPAPAPASSAPARVELQTASFPEVERPPGVHAWVRLSSPGRTLSELASWGGPLAAALPPLAEPERFLAALYGADVAELLELEGAADATFALHGASRVPVVSFALSGAVPGGLPALGVARYALPAPEPLPEGGRCELWNAAPPIGPRVLCGGSPELIARHGPFLLGTAARRAVGADVRVELAGEEYRALARGALSGLAPASSKGGDSDSERGEELGRAWARGLIEEHDELALELAFERDVLELSVAARFRSRRSGLTRFLLGDPGQGSTVPAAFWQLPARAALALGWEGGEQYGHDAAEFFAEQSLKELRRQHDVPEHALRRIDEVWRGLVPRSGAFVFAFGQDRFAVEQELHARAIPPATGTGLGPWKQPDLTRVRAALAGFWIVGLERPGAPFLAEVERFVALSNERWPKKKGALPEPEPKERSTLKKVALRAPELPGGTLHLVDQVRPNPRYRALTPDEPPPSRHDTHVFVVPLAERVWITASRSEEEARQRAFELVTEQPAERLSGVAALRSVPRQASFVLLTSAAGLLALELEGDTQAQRDAALGSLASLRSLPQGGQGAIPVWATSEALPGGDAHRATVRAELSRAVVQDLSMWAAMVAGESASAPAIAE